MATSTLRLRDQWLKPRLLFQQIQTPHHRPQSTFAHLQTELPKRKIQPIFDDLTPQNSYRLSTSLADYLPTTKPPPVLPPASNHNPLPLPHHLIYFEPCKPASQTLPDGTNPDQSPGEPFTRRMWAGGRVAYNPTNPLYLNSSRAVCAEFIRNVSIKGPSEQEKVFVAIERRIATATADEHQRASAASTDPLEKQTLEHRVRQRLWRDSEEDFGPCSVLETRNIVFLRSRTASEAVAEAARTGTKILKPQHAEPDWSHSIVPDAKLLFRFSALTFNAHAIHLDPEYARLVEGHRGLLFHGPLSFVFLVEVLQGRLRERGLGEVVRRVEYRNLAPLYCHEEVKFCGKEVGDGKWDVWAETPAGGVAVKGSVVTEVEVGGS